MRPVTPLLVLSILCGLGACAMTPQSRIERDPAAFAALPAEQQQRVSAGSVGVGYDQAATRLALGEPDRVIERETAEGISQVWVYYSLIPGLYNDGYCGPVFPYHSYRFYCRGVAPTQYEERARIVFKDGKVVSVENAR